MGEGVIHLTARAHGADAVYCGISPPGIPVAKQNYKFDKRQRDIAKQKKREEKLAKKQAKKAAEAAADGAAPPQDGLVPH